MTFEELKKIKDETAIKLGMRDVKNGYKVVVGMGTVGIAAGAKAVLNKFVEDVQLLGIYDATITQNGYIKESGFEPVVVVTDPKGNVSTYGNVTLEKVDEIVKKHIVGGQVVSELLVNLSE